MVLAAVPVEVVHLAAGLQEDREVAELEAVETRLILIKCRKNSNSGQNMLLLFQLILKDFDFINCLPFIITFAAQL